ncbi:MAG TPA: hypothetical protein VHU23_01000 [Rhizomicrobium sp.]|jgi:hypothetical protein|nr:hypothetical protein [Rhizomicrobium sp.]
MEECLAYTIPEFVVTAKVCKSKIYEDIAAGRLKAKKNGRRTVILRLEAERYLKDLPDASMGKASRR